MSASVLALPPSGSTVSADGPSGRWSAAWRSAARATSRPSPSRRSSPRSWPGRRALSGAPAPRSSSARPSARRSLSRLMVRHGRRPGLASGYVIGVVGAFDRDDRDRRPRASPLLLLGIGPDRLRQQLEPAVALCRGRPLPGGSAGSAIGIGGLGRRPSGRSSGRTSSGPAATVAVALGLPPLAGPYLVPIVFVGAAAILSFVLLRPDPYELADATAGADDGPAATSVAAGGSSCVDRHVPGRDRRPSSPASS